MRDGTAVAGRDHDVIFDGSFDGFLCVIHAHYYEKILPRSVSAADYAQTRLFGCAVTIETDHAKAGAVAAAIIKKISREAYEMLYQAFSGRDADYLRLFKFVTFGFDADPRVASRLDLDFVLYVSGLSRRTGREAHRYLGFVRFRETKSGALYADIEPDNFILPQLAEHFSQRLIGEKWMIHDIGRGLCAVYDGNGYFICEAGKTAPAVIDGAVDEDAYQKLWKTFYETIAVEDRIRKKRFDHMLPKKFRGHLTEFSP